MRYEIWHSPFRGLNPAADWKSPCRPIYGGGGRGLFARQAAGLSLPFGLYVHRPP